MSNLLDAGISPKASSLIENLRSFILDDCLPAEDEFVAFMDALGLPPGSPDRFASIPPILLTLQEKAKERGLWNLFLHEDHGITLREYGLLSELMGTAFLAPYATNCAAPDTGNMEVLRDFGSRVQKERWLAPLMDGAMRSSFLMTEPDVASSDATNVRTTFEKFKHQETGREMYRINGKKWWSTGALDPRLGVFVIMGKVEPSDSDDPHQSHTMIVVDSKSEGVNITRALTVFNTDDAPFGHAEVELTDVEVPVDEVLLHAEGSGFKIAQARLGPGRIHHCMRACGLGRRCYDLLVERSLLRKTFGKELIRHGMTQQVVADRLTDLETARALTLLCADKIDRVGARGARAEIAMIKFAVPDCLLRVVDDAIQVHGGLGVCQDSILATAWSYLRTLRIADGPDAVHKMTLARMEAKKMIKKLKQSRL